MDPKNKNPNETNAGRHTEEAQDKAKRRSITNGLPSSESPLYHSTETCRYYGSVNASILAKALKMAGDSTEPVLEKSGELDGKIRYVLRQIYRNYVPELFRLNEDQVHEIPVNGLPKSVSSKVPRDIGQRLNDILSDKGSKEQKIEELIRFADEIGIELDPKVRNH